MLTFDWTEWLKEWLKETSLSRHCTKRAARAAWGADIAAMLARDTAQCAVELELQRRQRSQPGARQSAATAARAALLAVREGTVASISAGADVRRAVEQAEQEAEQMEMEVRWRWKSNFGSLSSYGGVGHHMMERMEWQVGSRLGKQYSWQRVWRPVQATSYSNRTGIWSALRRTQSSQGGNAEPLRRRYSPLVFVGSSVQLSAKAAALAAAQVACRCLSLSRTMARYQARVRSGLAAMAACQAAAITMVAVRQAAECAAVMTATEAACAARTALQWMGAALAPLLSGCVGGVDVGD